MKILKQMSIVVLLFIIGWYIVSRLTSPIVKIITLPHQPISSTRTFTELRVGCYNIAHGRGGRLGAKNWEGGNQTEKVDRLKQIALLLRTNRLDIVVLNEVDFASVWSEHRDQAYLIAQEAGYPYLLEQRNVNVAIPFLRIQFGNAILSKYPITQATFLDYPNVSEIGEWLVGGFKEGVVGTVRLPDESLLQVVAVHLAVKSESIRVASAQMILAHYQRSKLPLIALGDFNTAPAGYPAHQINEKGQNAIEVLLTGLTTVLPALSPTNFTFPSAQPKRVIDWILVSPPWQIHQKTVIATDLSDHLPVIATLRQTVVSE